jgi:Ethanolamine ammonia-lyase light chain (EutC)
MTLSERSPSKMSVDDRISEVETSARLRTFTPARIGLARAGASIAAGPLLDFRAAHAAARDAVMVALDVAALASRLVPLPSSVMTAVSCAGDRREYLDLVGRLVIAEAGVNRVTQEPVGHPCQIGDFDYKLRLNPMNAGENEGRAEARAVWWRDNEWRCFAAEQLQLTPQIGKHLDRYPCAHSTGVGELAVVCVVPEQQRPEMRPRPLWGRTSRR